IRRLLPRGPAGGRGRGGHGGAALGGARGLRGRPRAGVALADGRRLTSAATWP
ncbi:DEAD/DEAH box helicase, partial [bacterium]